MNAPKVRPLTPHTGAEIEDLDLCNLTEESTQFLRNALATHGVLVFRNQPLTRDQHKAIGRAFGRLHVHPGKRLLGVKGDPEIFTVHTKPDSNYSNGEGWHSDVSCEVIPPLASLLYVAVPPLGGDTMFANAHEAFMALSEPIRRWLTTLTATHDGRQDLAAYDIQLRPDQDYPRAQHPVVIAHPTTSKPILFVNRSFTSRINGLTREESRAVLNMLCDHVASNPRWHCRVHWSPNTLVIWDNRLLQHHAIWDYYPETRYGERVTVEAESAPVRWQHTNH